MDEQEKFRKIKEQLEQVAAEIVKLHESLEQIRVELERAKPLQSNEAK